MNSDTRNYDVPLTVSNIGSIIINSIACPFTVLLNVLVIMAVKRRPRLQNNTNILLACLATTDILTGLAVQPSFISWKCIYVLENVNMEEVKSLHNFFLRVVSVCSLLHLMLITCERLIAIKFTMQYSYIVTKQNIKVAVIISWAFSVISGSLRFIKHDVAKYMKNAIASLVIIVCIVFILSAYIILYRETLRHRKIIKTQQLPQEEVERFAKESKALKTTVYVVGAVVLSFLPMALHQSWATVLGRNKKRDVHVLEILFSFVRTSAMLNSLLNPLIYCLRQKEMRKFIFRLPSLAVHPLN